METLVIESVESFGCERVTVKGALFCHMRLKYPTGDYGWYQATMNGFSALQDDAVVERLEAAYQVATADEGSQA